MADIPTTDNRSIPATMEDISKMVGDLHIQVYLSGRRISELERENSELRTKNEDLENKIRQLENQ